MLPNEYANTSHAGPIGNVFVMLSIQLKALYPGYMFVAHALHSQLAQAALGSFHHWLHRYTLLFHPFVSFSSTIYHLELSPCAPVVQALTRKMSLPGLGQYLFRFRMHPTILPELGLQCFLSPFRILIIIHRIPGTRE